MNKTKSQIRVFSNNDQAIIAWQYEAPIANCTGFSIFRKNHNESDVMAEPLKNKIGFKNEPHEDGELKNSTEWPIQRFTWTDFTVSRGDIVFYKVVPIIIHGNGKLTKDDTNSTEWFGPVRIDTGDKYQAYFNRGIISSQFFNQMTKEFADDLSGTSVKSIITGAANKVRDFLGGYLSEKLFAILNEVRNNKGLELHGALYELQQNDLIEKLKAIGKRAHIVLANGSFQSKGEDKNEEVREELKDAGVEVFDRIVDPNHFGHNKFLIISDKGQKKHVFTGSTNWTASGLFSQVNNGLFIKDNTVLGKAYFEEWEQLKNAGGSSVDNALIQFNSKPLPDSKFPHVWFSPKIKPNDLEEVAYLMEKAKRGILFLMFNPGPKNTLFNKILELQHAKPDLFIRGVINQDPGGRNPLIFFRKGGNDKANWEEILPNRISQRLGFFDTEKSAGLVTIHSKVIVTDPFTKNGVVITGSNNMGPKASQRNDDNLNILNDEKLVEEYAVNILAVYDHYRWRYSVSHANPNFDGLTKDSAWMKKYMNSERFIDIKNFWFK